MRKIVIILLFIWIPFLLQAITPMEFALTCTANEMQEAIDGGLNPNLNLDYSSITTGCNGRAFSINGIPISVYASGNPDPGVLSILVANGADVSARSEVLKKALMLDYATLDSVKTLLPYCNPVEMLMDAASYSSNTAVVEYIATQLGSVNSRGGGSYYLAYAVQNGNVPNAKLLIDMGADIHETTLLDGFEKNLLMLAAESGSVEMCQYILSLGYDVNEELDLRTALYYASNVETAQFLIEAGATELSTSSQWVISETLDRYQFELAAYYVNTLAENADIPNYVYNFIDRYLLNMSLQHSHVLRFASALTEVKRYALMEHIAYRLVDSEVDFRNYHDAVKEHIILLIALGYDFNTELDENGNSLLHFAVLDDNKLFNYIPYLLEAGADPNRPNKNGVSPLISCLIRLSDDYDDDKLLILIEMAEHGGNLNSATISYTNEMLDMSEFNVGAFIPNIAQLRSQI